MRRGIAGVGFVVCFLLAAPSAQAQLKPVPVGPAPADPGPAYRSSITLSPIHMIVGPIIEATVEFKAGPRLGVAGMLGAGKYSPTDEAGNVMNTFDVFEAGVSLRWYVWGDFDGGVQLGGSAEYVKLSGDNVNGSGISAVGNGLSLSPFIGYKKIWGGFTFDSQLGPSVVAIRAEGENGEQASDSDIGVNLNLNIGWSF